MSHVTPNLGTVGITSPPGQRGAVAVRAPTRSQIQARNGASRPRHRPRHSQGAQIRVHPHGGARPWLIGMLAVATVAAVGFMLLRGSGDAAATGDFASSHERVVTARAGVAGAVTQVQRELDLDRFNQSINALLNTMGEERNAFRHIAADSEGAQRAIALRAVTATISMIDATDDYRRAIAFSEKLADAQAANQRIDAALAQLDGAAAEWKQT